MFIDHISWQLAVEFVAINIASEAIKYIGVKVFQVIDAQNTTFLDVVEVADDEIPKMDKDELKYWTQLRVLDDELLD